MIEAYSTVPGKTKRLWGSSNSLPRRPDGTTDDPRLECVDVKAVKPVNTPVALQSCRKDPRLTGMVPVSDLCNGGERSLAMPPSSC